MNKHSTLRFSPVFVSLVLVVMVLTETTHGDTASIAPRSSEMSTRATISQLDDKTRAMLSKFRELEARIQALSQENLLIEQNIGRQERAIAQEKQEIDDARRLLSQLDMFSDQLQQNLVPLDKQFPFQTSTVPEENLDNPESTQRFLSSLKLWSNELVNGSRLAAWDGQLPNGQQVEFVRLGRVALYYLTPDGKDAAMYLSHYGDWQPLSHSQIRELIRARDIARGERKTDWLYLPVPDIAVTEGEHH
ncbi:DUF3450 family protein [Sansalvadorimonas verongulae]|uniref:DUF3450 family protein n=1 Tax=Sansalvadorimonas verongulae TaxID=2172824 RepID=UPI0018AD25B7|nr:DUF3450 family protein [Sansalvadorimonas verongulae]